MKNNYRFDFDLLSVKITFLKFDANRLDNNGLKFIFTFYNYI